MREISRSLIEMALRKSESAILSEPQTTQTPSDCLRPNICSVILSTKFCISGVLFILIELIFSKYFTIGALPHPEFPHSIIASLSAGIGEELIFRLFFISFWVWLISHILLKKKWQNQIFWIISAFSALAFAFGHMPSIMILFNLSTLDEIPTPLLSEIIILNSLVSLPAAYYFRKYGFLAAVGIHFWTDIIWHVIYPNLNML